MDERFPLRYQIICIVLTALFIWAFSIAREPRQWRRLYQSRFSNSDDFSVNRNKAIDESLKKYGIVVAMVILVLDVGFFLWGATSQARANREEMTKEMQYKLNEVERVQGGSKARSKTL